MIRSALRRRLVPLGLAFSLLGAPLGPALGSSMEVFDLAVMVERAERIFQGVVVAAEAADSGEGQIWTTYQVRVIDALKGVPETRTLEVKQIGGTVGGVTLRAVMVPHFRVGDEVLFFTRDYGMGWQSVVNGPQGSLVLAPAGAPISEPARIASSFYPEAPTELAAFKALVQRLVAAGEPK